MEGQMGAMFYAGLLVTLALIVAAGVYAARMVRSAEDYSVGGHKSGPMIVIGVFVGTLVGGAATIGTAQLAFCVGLSAWWFTLGCGVGLLALGLFYAKPLRGSSLETISQFLVLNFGERAGLITSVSSSIGIFFSIVASFLSAAHLLSAVFGLPVAASIALMGVVILVSIFGGGINGVGLVGVIKLLLVYVTMCIGGLAVYGEMGGWQGFAGSFPAFPWFSLVEKGFWPTMGDLLAMVVGILATQTYVQAVYSARSTRVAAVSCFASALIIVPIGLPVIAIGMFMQARHPDILPINALPLFMLQYMPPFLGGAGIMALLISSVGSSAGLALGVATMLSRDLLAKWARQGDSARMLRLNRLCVLAVTLIAAVVTYVNMHAMVLNLNFYSMAFRAAAVIVPMSIAIFLPGRLGAHGAVGAMAAGIGAALLTPLLFPPGVNPIMPGLAASFAVALCLMLLRNHAEKARL